MILNYPEERVCTGVPRLGSDEEMMAARIAASREVLDYRHGGVPPRQDDPVVAMAGASTAADVHLNRLQKSSSNRSNTYVGSEWGQQKDHSPVAQESTGGVEGEIYQEVCDRQGCGFKTIKSSNPLAYAGIVAALQLHISDKHPTGEDNDSGSMGHAERQSLLEATKMLQLPAGCDDRVRNFHDARFLMGPLDPQAAAKKSPLMQSPVYGGVDLTHIGIQIGNERTVKLCHDRGTKALKLQMFSPINLGMTLAEHRKRIDLEGGQLVHGKDFKDLRNVGDAIMACHAYAELESHLHPMCYGGKALMRLLLLKYTEGKVTKISQVLRMFMTVQNENSNRAIKLRAPLTFEELLVKWDGLNQAAIPAAEVSGAKTEGVKAQMDKLQKEVRETFKMLQGTPGRSKRGISPPGRKGRDKVRKTSGWCEAYNQAGGCSFEEGDGGCVRPDGSRKKHGCNYMVDNKPCNSLEHNRPNHG